MSVAKKCLFTLWHKNEIATGSKLFTTELHGLATDGENTAAWKNPSTTT